LFCENINSPSACALINWYYPSCDIMPDLDNARLHNRKLFAMRYLALINKYISEKYIKQLTISKR